jgi:hypothetical protein
MAHALTRLDACDMTDLIKRGNAGALRFASIALVLMAAFVVLGACGGGDDDGDGDLAVAEQTAPESGTQDLDQFLMRNDEEPGFRRVEQPRTLTGVEAFVNDLAYTQDDAQRLRSEGFISFTMQPIRGPRTAGVTNVTLYETGEGAQRSLAHESRPDVIRKLDPVEDLRFFSVPRIPGARGWTASLPGQPASHDVGNLYWVQGRCMLVLGNQGPGPFAGPLSTGARAIYERTNGQCP